MSLHHHSAIEALKQDELLAPVIEQIALPDFNPTGDVYSSLIESIVSQQLSVKAADTIHNRLLDKMPHRKPHPEYILELSMEEMSAIGLSGQKSQYIKNVAQFSLENDLIEHHWHLMTDEEIIQFLSSIKGVGVWTVQMILMFTLDRPDVFPIDDLGIRQAVARLTGLDASQKTFKAEALQVAERWRPYRTYASRILWRFKDTV